MTVEEWAKDFKSYIDELQMPRDDYKGIIAYIEDGVELLKEQKAHLITEDDFVNADHYGYIPAWTEERNGDQFWKCIIRRSLNSDTQRFRY